jgi:hypothetical protein
MFRCTDRSERFNMSRSILSIVQISMMAVVLCTPHLYADDKGTEVNGVISAVDPSSRTITLQVGAEAKEFEFGRKTKISVDGKDASVDQLRIGQTVILLVDEALGVAVSIQAKQGDAKSVTVKGPIVSVDAAARLIRIATDKGKEQEFEISRRAKTTIAGKEATVGDLTADQVVTLEIVPGLELVTAITADAVGVGAKAAAPTLNDAWTKFQGNWVTVYEETNGKPADKKVFKTINRRIAIDGKSFTMTRVMRAEFGTYS